MNIDDLKTFVAIARAGGIHAASEHLHKTQPAISKALRRLEEELGLQLMDRSSYRATTTKAGDAILSRAEGVLTQLNRLESFAASLANGQEERVRIAVHSSLPDEIWTPFIGVVTAKFPDTVAHVTREEVAGAVRRLQRKEVDLALTPWEVREADSLEDAVQIGWLELVNVVSAEKWATYCANAADVCHNVHQVIVTDSVADDGLTYGVFAGTRQIRVPDQATKTALIREGLGWGRVPRHLAAHHLARKTLVEFQSANQPATMSYPIYCIKLKSRESGVVISELWSYAHILGSHPHVPRAEHSVT